MTCGLYEELVARAECGLAHLDDGAYEGSNVGVRLYEGWSQSLSPKVQT